MLQSMGLQRVGRDLATEHTMYLPQCPSFCHHSDLVEGQHLSCPCFQMLVPSRASAFDPPGEL